MIEDGKKVRFHYSLSIDGEIIDSSEGKEPFEYDHGASQIIIGLEKALEGMSPGERKEVEISPEDAYGMADKDAIAEIPKDRIRSDDLEVGMILTSADEGGGDRQGVIQEINEDSVVVDFNHPLAGKRLFFDLEVVSVD